LLVIGSVVLCFNFYFTSLCKGNTTGKKIAITFDDGPHPEITPKLLEILKKHQLPAAFFWTGENTGRHQDLVKKAHDQGHLIANHSYSHSPRFDLFNYRKMTAEIEAANKEIESIIGKRPLLFRPPYGVSNPALGRAIFQTGITSIGWSLRSFDTIHTPPKVLKKLKKKTRPGDIVLFHDTRKNTPGIVEEYLRWLKENGYEVVPLEKLLNIEGYE